MGEVAAFAQILTHAGILNAIQDQVRFARARFGTYDVIDFVAVLIGYALSGEPTLLAFYERLAPFAEPFRPISVFLTKKYLDFAHFTLRSTQHALAERGLSVKVKWHQGFEVMPKNQIHPKDADERQRAHH